MVHTFKLYLLMIKWQLLNMKEYLPFIVLVQIIIGVGVVYGLGFMYPDIDSLSAKYITTGATMMSLAHLSPSPVLAGVATNGIFLSLFLFSPVNFPIDRPPAGLSHIHMVLPVKYMADLVRGTVTTGLADNLGLAFGVVGAWCAISVLVLSRVVTRRT